MGFRSLRIVQTLFIIFFTNIVLGFELTILHTNDIHAHIEEFNKYGGMCTKFWEAQNACYGGSARIATQVEAIRKSHKNVLLLDAGDQFQGTLWYTVFGGSLIAKFMNLIGYDVMALGNHEFDDGPTGLANFLNVVKFPVISSNVDVSKDVQLRDKIAPSVEFELEGEKVAIIGYTTTDTPNVSRPGPKITFEDAYKSIQKEVDAAKNRGVNKTIVLGHGGAHVDMALAKQLTDVDLMVGGHTDTFLYNGVSPTEEDHIEGPYPIVIDSEVRNNTRILIVQDYMFGKYLGKITINFDEDGNVVSYSGNPILLSSNITEDPTVLRKVTKKKGVFDTKLSKVIGTTRVMMNSELCTKGECNFGNFITDSMLDKNLQYETGSDGWTDVAIAIMNAGSIRMSISNEEGGEISIGDIQQVLPFRNTIDIVGLRGSTIKKVMEHSFSLVGHPRFLQVAGMKVVANTSRPVGSRISSIMVQCADCDTPVYVPLNDDAVYKVAMPTFLADGGDGYTMIRDDKTLHEIQSNLDSDVVIEYISKMSPIHPAVEGRIILWDKISLKAQRHFCGKKQ